MLLLGEDAFDHLVREIAVDGGELFVVGRDLVGEDHLKGNHEFGKHFWENLAVARLLARKLNRPIEPKRAPLTNDLNNCHWLPSDWGLPFQKGSLMLG